VASTLRATLLFVIIPNLLYFLVARFFYLDRPLINLDYAVLGIAWPFLRRWLRITSFAVAFLADAITSTGSMYNISPVAGVVALFRAPIGLLITVILAFAASCALAAGLGKLIDKHYDERRATLTLTLTVTLTVVAVTLALPIRSGTTKLTQDIIERDQGYRATPERMAAATDALRDNLETQNDNVAIVVVESWGVLSDTAAHNALLDIFNNAAISQKYNVATGSVRFRGGTTSGELRELCGVFTDYLVLNDATIARCLPVQMRARGFRTVALHGYKQAYYSRNVWYPRFFDRMLFEDSLALNDRRCGTQFRGVCDRDVFQAFAREVRSGRRQLTYWLTIDAHTPVDMARLDEFRRGTCPSPADVCLVIAFWRDLFQNLAGLAAEPALPPTRFIIVGDHAPAFVRRSRAQRLVPGRVPYVELVPRPIRPGFRG
jgi:phosphoglycerol transferase MdoB-like AlkP superfamily enzyme